MLSIDDFRSNRKKDYAIYLVSLSSYRSYYLSIYDRLMGEHRLSEDEFEHLFDWLITHALDSYLRVSTQARVLQHYRHDVYRCVYDEFGYVLESFIGGQLSMHQLNFLRNEEVKALVAGDTLIITRGLINNARL